MALKAHRVEVITIAKEKRIPRKADWIVFGMVEVNILVQCYNHGSSQSCFRLFVLSWESSGAGDRNIAFF